MELLITYIFEFLSQFPLFSVHNCYLKFEWNVSFLFIRELEESFAPFWDKIYRKRTELLFEGEVLLATPNTFIEKG